ncbi:Acetyltransferase [Kitasatospora sp. MMS16-BH015]|uniref:GNAT family N-acetyltransferase n=1 Tax=Kitasatospora sp. MMS16-BH015 TaxID=2018025 RepID=UPI000CA0AB9B|nr:GNAT family N-acetyltransferase [Kitasatospora sp. MMS16-BH015]AUG79468.1 Acetyltransferase [Kitasatospora sp. MMS16-BH015]
MITVRPATPADAPELVRLRALMFAAMAVADGREPEDESGGPAAWRSVAERELRSRLGGAETTMPAFVVDDPAHPGRLASCAVGTLERRLPAPGHPDGLFGFVFNISTDPAARHRGYARACTEALLAWFDARGATRIDLHATEDGQQLYRSLGFHEHSVALSRKPA